MAVGATRTDVEYIWPRALSLPQHGLRLVYLDLNHWISLAKAAVGHRDGVRHRDALDAIRRASAEVVFPLGSVHYMEMAGIKDPRQRFDVADIMEEVSGLASIASGAVVMQLELDAALARVTGDEERPSSVPFLGHSVLHAFGLRGGLRIHSPGGDVTDVTRESWPGGPTAFDAWSDEAERRLSRAVLRGPTDEEVESLTASGWDPTVARRMADERAQSEADLARRLTQEPRWRRGRLRDVVGARYLAMDAEAALAGALAALKIGLNDVGTNVEAARRFTDSMPSADVRISLLTAAHRNPQTTWTANDIFDLDALSVAVPYCDIVVTERRAHHVLHAAGLPERLRTTVLASLDHLIPVLADS